MQRKRDIALTIAIFSGAFIMGCTPNAGPQTAPTTGVQITKGPASSPGASESPKAIGGSPAPALSPAPLASTRPDAGPPPSPQASGQSSAGNPYASPPAGAILVNGGEVKSMSA
ncbi:MAG: hypothetical protein EB084_15110, partial [Proteobacteria bacterium]|nr:hypothetical protein [Pseudomonadota bacterium]